MRRPEGAEVKALSVELRIPTSMLFSQRSMLSCALQCIPLPRDRLSQPPDDARHFIGAGTELLKFLLSQISGVQGNVQLRTNFSGGCLFDREKLMKFRSSIAFEAFDDVRHHRNRRSLQLAAKPKVFGKRATASCIVDRFCSAAEPFARPQLLEAVHGASLFVRAERKALSVELRTPISTLSSQSSKLLYPVPREFLQEGKRGEVLHAVEVDFAVQMIELVLDYARVKVVGFEVELLAVSIESLNVNAFIARHAAAQVGNAEASFPVFLGFIRQRRDLRID